MTVEEKLAHFLEASVQENTIASEKMLKNYQATLDEQFEAHKNTILQQASAEMDAAMEEIRREANKKQAHEHLIIKRMLSQKNSELKEKLFEEFASLVKDYKQTPAYTELLKNRILQAKDQASARGDEMIIYLDPEDADKQEALQQETGVTLQISQYGFGGGIRAVIPSRHILIDHSFDSKITELKENFHFHGGNVNG